MATQSLILQPGGHKMPLLGFGTWKVDKNSTADVVYKVTLNIDEGEKKVYLLDMHLLLKGQTPHVICYLTSYLFIFLQAIEAGYR